MEYYSDGGTEQIKILIRTNIPGSDEFTVLTKDMLVVKDKTGFSDYPYFSENFLYPINILNGYSYDDKVSFFFNENKFKKIMSYHKITLNNVNSKIIDYTTDEKNDDSFETEKISVMSINIETMISMLFPTTFPAIDENINSYTQYIKKEQPNLIIIKGNFADFFTSIAPSFKTDYSYLNIGGSVHTVTKTIWLNDILNHPKYTKLITSFVKIKKWISDTRKGYNFDGKIMEYIKSIKKLLDNDNNKDFILQHENILNNSISPINLNRTYNSYIDDDTIKNFKSDVRKLFGYSNDDKMTKIVSFSEPIKPDTNNNNKNIRFLDDNPVEINNNNIDDIPTFNLKETIALIKVINKKISDRKSLDFLEKSNLLNIFTIITENSEKIEELEYLRDTYFDKYPNNSFINDEKIRIELKNEVFSKYIEYINELENYKDTNFKCSNYILQKTLNSYINNTDLYLNEYLDYLGNIYYSTKSNNIFPYSDVYYPINIFGNSKFPLFVGITNSENNQSSPKYELYLQIDLLKGQLTKDTEKFLSCEYKNNQLGYDLTNKIDNNHINSSIVLRNKNYTEIPIPTTSTPNTVNNNSIIDKKTVKIGGRKTKKKHKPRFNKKLCGKTKKKNKFTFNKKLSSKFKQRPKK